MLLPSVLHAQVLHIRIRKVMSPIIKRDISEHVRHARRLAAAATGQIFDDRIETSPGEERFQPLKTYASGSSPRQGIGVYEDDRQTWYPGARWEREDRKGKGRAVECPASGEESDEEIGERGRMLFDSRERGSRDGMEDGDTREELETSSSLTKERWDDLRNLLLEVSAGNRRARSC